MEKDKRYLVFAYYQYYPSGGMDDNKESFDTLEEANIYRREECKNYDYTEVYDRIEGIQL